MIGHIPEVQVGQVFSNRRELHDAGVHRGLQQGIGAQGASIVLSGGYVDDLDEGDSITYTGEGGRDLNTGRQIADQTFTRGNSALVRNHLEGNPIRVIRGHSLESSYAPEAGYKYDGLYRIDQYWQAQGRDGFKICRFQLRRLEDQEPLFSPDNAGPTTPGELGNVSPGRSSSTVSRVVRSTAVGIEVKGLYDYTCQICGLKLETPGGPYAECCHIRPLGRPHNGPDTLDNVLCLCPNHHLLFDTHAMHLTDDLRVLETGEPLRTVPSHTIGMDHVRYHRGLGPS